MKLRPPQSWSQELSWSQVCTQKAASGKEGLGTGRVLWAVALSDGCLPHVPWPPVLCSQPRSVLWHVWAIVLGPGSPSSKGVARMDRHPLKPRLLGPREESPLPHGQQARGWYQGGPSAPHAGLGTGLWCQNWATVSTPAGCPSFLPE